MNADAFRHLYAFHFAENRKLWDRHVAGLTQAQFTQPVAYSVGSVRDQIVHLMSCDDYWFSGLRGLDMPDMRDPAPYDDRELLRAHWDAIEGNIRDYLADLRDDMLLAHPFAGTEDEALVLWQVLLHVTHHGMDHRSQLLRILHELGCDTGAQDYIFHIFDNL
jgi:uncharacterized damage-inducible protein DinB